MANRRREAVEAAVVGVIREGPSTKCVLPSLNARSCVALQIERAIEGLTGCWVKGGGVEEFGLETRRPAVFELEQGAREFLLSADEWKNQGR